MGSSHLLHPDSLEAGNGSIGSKPRHPLPPAWRSGVLPSSLRGSSHFGLEPESVSGAWVNHQAGKRARLPSRAGETVSVADNQNLQVKDRYPGLFSRRQERLHRGLVTSQPSFIPHCVVPLSGSINEATPMPSLVTSFIVGSPACPQPRHRLPYR